MPAAEDVTVPTPHRASAAVLERSASPARHAQISGARAARRALVPVQHRVHPPHQRPRSDDDVQRIVFEADYLVLGLGDVYLGAPVATPLDPRHRLVTTKYNPARTWTPENAVGIGGAYLCVYGMEGPGGYQLFGRTIQMWNSLAHDRSSSRAIPGCCASSTRSGSSRSASGAARGARGFPAWPLSAPDRGDELFATARLCRLPRRAQDARSTRSKRRQQAAFEAERARLAGAAASTASSATMAARVDRPRTNIPDGMQRGLART